MKNEKLMKIADDIMCNLPNAFKYIKKNFQISTEEHNKIRIVAQVHFSQKTNMTDISNKMCLPKSNITNIVNDLVKDGYISRETDENDRRLIYLKTTEKGAEYLKLKKGEFNVNIIEKLKVLDAEELDEFEKNLESIIRILNKMR